MGMMRQIDAGNDGSKKRDRKKDNGVYQTQFDICRPFSRRLFCDGAPAVDKAVKRRPHLLVEGGQMIRIRQLFIRLPCGYVVP